MSQKLITSLNWYIMEVLTSFVPFLVSILSIATATVFITGGNLSRKNFILCCVCST